ncbi:MAG: hypothetical protein P4L31_08260 [Candidatus Babeliales bacterium]|nr:hypothetical protein [Candidatus Babeliales bacterium]
MNHTYKCALALTLLATQTYTVCPINYKSLPALASTAIATSVTAAMLYNFFYPTSDQTLVDRAVTECQSVKNLHNDISFIHENELMIIDQSTKSATSTEIFDKIKKEIPAKSNEYALYYYVGNLDYDINQLEEKVQRLACLQTNLFNRIPKKSDEKSLLAINFDNAISEIQALRAELKDLITKLFTIRTHVASTPEYAHELNLYRASQETEQVKDDSDERYSICTASKKEEEKIKAPDAIVTAPEVTEVIVEATTDESSSRAQFNSDWCDMTNPFNS